MEQNQQSWFERHWRAVCFIVGLLGCLALVIGGIGWTDYAETPFWQVAWIVFAALGAIGFIGGIYWYFTSKKKW